MTGELAPVDRLWPFGKYRGQAVERAMADHSYMAWVLAQPWLADDYPQLYALITGSNSGEPQDSPEHNEFQIRFLDEQVRLAVARRLGYQELDGAICGKRKAIARKVGRELGCPVSERQLPLSVSAVRFEDQGWDVSFEIRPASYAAWLDAASYGKLYIELLEGWGMAKLALKMRNRLRESHATLDVAVYEPNTARRPRVVIELKPDLGDDYPSVLRQMQRYPTSPKLKERKLLIVRRARFTTVSFEQVKAFFKSADITLLMEWELEILDAGAELTGVVEETEPVSAGKVASKSASARAKTSGRVLEPVATVAGGTVGAAETVYSEFEDELSEDLDPVDSLDEDLAAEVEDFFGTDDDDFEEIDPELLD